jgi:hypothetical protein
MLEFTLRAVWKAMNNAYHATIGTETLGLMTILVFLHIILAAATLGLGDRTICDIFRPLRKIFRPDAESIIDGALEVTVAIPRAIFYYVSLYFRSYILALRVLLLLWLSLIPALLTPILLSIVTGIAYGFSSPIEQNSSVAQLVILSFYPSLAYWYWRIDGQRLFVNIRNACNC